LMALFILSFFSSLLFGIPNYPSPNSFGMLVTLIVNNALTFCMVSLAFGGISLTSAHNTAITNNTIRFVPKGITVNFGSGSNNIFSGNTVQFNSNYKFLNNLATNLTAENNCWGTANLSTLQAKISSTVDFTPYVTTDECIIEDIPKLTILFVPLNWSGSQIHFQDEAKKQLNVFLDDTNLASCKERVTYEFMNVANEDNYIEWDCNATINPLFGIFGEADNSVASIKDFVEKRGKDPDNYKRIIGIANYTKLKSVCPVGKTIIGESVMWVSNEFNISISHEMGHTFGLAEQYCSTDAGSPSSLFTSCNSGPQPSFQDINYLDGNLPYDCPADGSNASNGVPCCNFIENGTQYLCLPNKANICCLGNKNVQGGRSFMSFSDVQTVQGGSGPRAFDDREKLYLNNADKNPELTCLGPGTPQEIVDIKLLIYQNNTVKLNSIIQEVGEAINHKKSDAEYYALFLNQNGSIVANLSIEPTFSFYGNPKFNVEYPEINWTSSVINIRIPYNSTINELRVFHNGIIFSQNISFCNNNTICENSEYYGTCPLDCPLNQTDKVCLPLDDGICDPDCDIDVDVSCSLDLESITNISKSSNKIIFEIKAKNFANQTIANITWMINNGETIQNSTINSTLLTQEDIFIYYEYNYTISGNYTVIATIQGGIYSDNEAVNITV